MAGEYCGFVYSAGSAAAGKHAPVLAFSVRAFLSSAPVRKRALSLGQRIQSPLRCADPRWGAQVTGAGIDLDALHSGIGIT